MREYLFRGKRKDNGAWVEGYLAAHDLICPSYPEDTLNVTGEYFGQTPYVGFVEVDPETVGPFTGLRDKNSKRIFEGDILDHHAQSDIIVNRGVVFWDEKNARWAHKLKSMNPSFYMYKTEAFEVVGNIHDNPELM